MDKRRLDGRGSWCKPCNRDYLRDLSFRADQLSKRKSYYAKHKEELKIRNQLRWKERGHLYESKRKSWAVANRTKMLTYYATRRDRVREFFASLKSQPCVDCGNTFPPECVDFDHVRGIKRYPVGKMLHHKYERIVEEIAKCDVVCSNCHRVRTHERRSNKRVFKENSFQTWVRNLKMQPCSDCGKCFHPVAMDFDHVRGNKVTQISNMTSYSQERVLVELGKCDLVCSNCHRIRTILRLEKETKP